MTLEGAVSILHVSESRRWSSDVDLGVTLSFGGTVNDQAAFCRDNTEGTKREA